MTKLRKLFAIFTMAVLAGCNGNVDPGDSDGPSVTLLRPTNSQLLLCPFDVLGNASDELAISEVTVKALPVYGGATNSFAVEMTGSSTVVFGAEARGLNDGFYFIWAEAVNSDGETGKSQLTLIEVGSEEDSTPPVLSILTPTNNQVVGSSFTISGSVSDADSGVDGVYISLDSGAYKAVSVANGSWATNVELSIQGGHSVSVYAVDRQGNESSVSTVSVNYSALVPSVVVSSPVYGYLTNYGIMDFSGTASVAYPGAIDGVQVFAPGYDWKTASLSGDANDCTWLVEDVWIGEGTNEILVQVWTTNHYTNQISTSVIVDWQPPVINLTAPELNDVFSNDTTINVIGLAQDAMAGIKQIYVGVDGANFTAIGSSEAWSTGLNLSAGRHSIDVYGLDNAGNYSSTNSVDITVISVSSNDTTPPTLTISSPTEGHSQSGVQFELSGSASDTSGVAGVYLSVDEMSYTKVSGTNTWSSNITLTMGAHALRFYAIDTVGNKSTAQTVNVTRTSSGDILTVHYDNSQDWGSPMMHYGFGYYDGVTDIDPSGYDSFGPFYEIDWSSTTEDYLTTCFNNNGGDSWDGTDREIDEPASFPSEVWIEYGSSTVLTSNPNDVISPTVTLTSPTNNQELEGEVTLSATASDNQGVTLVEFYLGSTLIESDSSSPYSVNWNSAYSTDGSHFIFARAYDAAGNTADSEPVSVTTDNTNVAPIADAGADQTVLVNTPVLFNAGGSYDPNGYIVSYSWDNGMSGENPTHTYTSTGTNTVTLTVTDDEGSIATDSVTIYVVDSMPSVFSWDNATVYFVLTDRFYNGNTGNDNSYGRASASPSYGTFHGGDIAGLTDKLNEGYFTNLGINAIWITAPYEQIHGWVVGDGDIKHYAYHGYYVLDYTLMDANMGTAAEFQTFVDTAHEQGIRIIMDVVMNHAGYNTHLDMDAYSFGELYSGWESATPYNMHDFINYSSGNWVNWWGPDWIRSGLPGYTEGSGDLEGSLASLPDFKTEATSAVHLPPFYANKANTLAVDMYASGWTVRDYLINWLCDWVETYGIDGFRCDTAKHVELNAWLDLKTNAMAALQTWKTANPDKALDDLDFWMTGECWGHGVSTGSDYYNYGYDSMINFDYKDAIGNGLSDYYGIESTYNYYASTINNTEGFNVLSYISSHDDDLFWNGDSARQKRAGTLFMLTPGGIQVYYGDEYGRDFNGASGDHNYRSSYDWNNTRGDVLSHWGILGRFRNKHLSVGAGSHSLISSSPYTFSRSYSEGGIDDNVICVLGTSGATTVDVSSIWADGTLLRDYYSGNTATVSGGNVTLTPSSDILLIEIAD